MSGSVPLNNESVQDGSSTSSAVDSQNAPGPELVLPSSQTINPNVLGVDPSHYNQRNPAVKRLLREAAELSQPSEEIYARPLEDNLFEWHFTIRGALDSDFQRGIYHGRIILPPEYPMKPPSIILLTPNGRFETGTKICLSISSYHPETWRPSWSIRTALVALISFMTTDSPGAIGSLELPSADRQELALRSLTWECPQCGLSINHLRYSPAADPRPPGPRRLNPLSVPHDPNQPLDTDPIPEEVLIRNRNAGVAPPYDGRRGDARGGLQPQLDINQPHLEGNHDRFIEEDDMDEDDDGFSLIDITNDIFSYNMGIAVVAFGIGGLLLRRFYIDWWDFLFH